MSPKVSSTKATSAECIHGKFMYRDSLEAWVIAHLGYVFEAIAGFVTLLSFTCSEYPFRLVTKQGPVQGSV